MCLVRVSLLLLRKVLEAVTRSSYHTFALFVGIQIIARLMVCNILPAHPFEAKNSVAMTLSFLPQSLHTFFVAPEIRTGPKSISITDKGSNCSTISPSKNDRAKYAVFPAVALAVAQPVRCPTCYSVYPLRLLLLVSGPTESTENGSNVQMIG